MKRKKEKRLEKATKKYMKHYWGRRCKEYKWECVLCQAWKKYDSLFR